MSRQCNKKCTILKFIDEKETCPIIYLPKPRKSKDWYLELKDEKYYPLCEDKDQRTKINSNSVEIY